MKKYNLTDIQLRHLSIICYREQGNNIAGVKACASHMCNYFELWGKGFSNLYECVFGSGWYWDKSKNERWVKEHPSVPQNIIEAVRDVICNGNRTLPEYVDEYDCLSDIAKASNNGRTFTPSNRHGYIKDVTEIVNVYGSAYTFYCFPDGADGTCDAFGYIRKDDEMTTVEKATQWMEDLARDNSHGYDQVYRWGERNDYDCSSAVITAWEKAGVPVKSKGGATYTGNMRTAFLKYGFKDVTASCNIATGAGLKRGDVLLNTVHHVAMYIGNGQEVEASINEKGGATGGQPGDQTGREILIRSYRNYPWNYVLRYESTDETEQPTERVGVYMFTVNEVKKGSTGTSAKLLQKLLRAEGYYGADGKVLTVDGDAGNNTIHALKNYQRSNGLSVDGVCGQDTWKRILGV